MQSNWHNSELIILKAMYLYGSGFAESDDGKIVNAVYVTCLLMLHL